MWSAIARRRVSTPTGPAAGQPMGTPVAGARRRSPPSPCFSVRNSDWVAFVPPADATGMALRATDRRTVLVAAGTAVSTLLAGCSEVSSQLTDDDGNESDDANESDDGTASGPDEETARTVIEDYLDAAAAGDTEAMAAVLHTSSPLHPDHWDDSEWEFQTGPYEDVGGVTVDQVNAEATASDVADLEGADLWFPDEELDDAIGSGEVATVDAAVEGLDTEPQNVWVLVTEDGEWQLFLISARDDTPEDPEEALEEPIRDEDGDVVERVDWDYDQEDPQVDGEWARVVLTEDPGVEADAVRIESTIAGSETEFYTPADAEQSTPSWPGSWASVRLNPAGDQIVVTAIDDGEETVVHRVHYDP